MGGNAMTAAPHVVNGINVDDLFALIEGVRKDPAKGKTQWRVATTWLGQARSRAEVEGFGIGGGEVPRHFSIYIGEPCELGGYRRLGIIPLDHFGRIRPCRKEPCSDPRSARPSRRLRPFVPVRSRQWYLARVHCVLPRPSPSSRPPRR
jgi:hypothetical protein